MPTNTLLTSTEGMGGILPEEYGELITQPVERESVAYQVCQTVATDSSEFHIPIIGEDVSAQWVAEGEEIDPSTAKFGELVVYPKKIAALTPISRELADDSSPKAAELVGKSIARDITKRIDEAFFGATMDYGPQGLEDLDGVSVIGAPAAWADLDPFVDAMANAEILGARVTSWVAHPDDAKTLAKLRDEEGSNRQLLAPGTSNNNEAVRMIQNVPLFVSPAVTRGTVWGIPNERVLLVQRKMTEIAVNDSLYFTSDRLAIRGIMRLCFAHPHPAAIQKIMLTQGS